MAANDASNDISIFDSIIEKFKGSPHGIPLDDGDSLYIPERPDHVHVIGAVYNLTSFVYDPRGNVSSYIKKAGGLTGNAEEDDLYILKLDGTAVSKRE